jgi:hypothetical protein
MILKEKLNYSTQQTIKTPPLVLRVFLWRYVSHCNLRNFLTAEDSFFSRSDEILIDKSYTLDIFVGLTPNPYNPVHKLRTTLFSTISAVLKLFFF